MSILPSLSMSHDSFGLDSTPMCWNGDRNAPKVPVPSARFSVTRRSVADNANSRIEKFGCRSCRRRVVCEVVNGDLAAGSAICGGPWPAGLPSARGTMM